MEYIYKLSYKYRIDGLVYETKLIGMYSSNEKVMEVIVDYYNNKNINEQSNDFVIEKYEIDKNMVFE